MLIYITKMLSSIVYFFLNPVGFSFKRKTSSEKVFNLLFITNVHNLPKQLKIVIGRKFLGSIVVPLFLYNGTMLPASQVSGIIPDLKIILNR